MSEHKLKIGITQGDTNGIGWEVIIKALAHPAMTDICTPVVYGSKRAAEFYASRLAEESVQFHSCASASAAQRGRVNLVDCGGAEVRIEAGTPSRGAAEQAIAALDAATEALRRGEIDAVVTAPINKESMHEAGFAYTGHTEYLGAKFGGKPMMIMCSELLRVALMTVHVPVEQVASMLTEDAIVERLVALRHTLKSDFGIVEPRIAVLSLNPHAGDGGLLGTEEEQVIRPAVRRAYDEGVLCFGPMAADGLFGSGEYAKYDAVLAMYHDQGLTPFKTLSPEGVNVTAGLDVVRTSPDHGTGYDIAGKGIADAQSMRNAIYEALDLVRRRRAYAQWSRNPLEHFEREKGRDVSMKDLQEAEEN